MVRSLNKVMVIGNIGRAPEMRYMPNGRAVTSFSVGATRSWSDDEGVQHEETEWFNVVTWGDLAERCKGDLQKNDRVYVEGRLQTRRWETSDGSSRFRAELVANEMIFLNRSKEADTVLASATDE
jgi:single-strand DNA-binding protein